VHLKDAYHPCVPVASGSVSPLHPRQELVVLILRPTLACEMTVCQQQVCTGPELNPRFHTMRFLVTLLFWVLLCLVGLEVCLVLTLLSVFLRHQLYTEGCSTVFSPRSCSHLLVHQATLHVSACVCMCLSACLSACLLVCLCICLFVCLCLSPAWQSRTPHAQAQPGCMQ